VHTVLVDMRARLAKLRASGPDLRGRAGDGQAGGPGRPAAGAGLDGVVLRGRDDGHGDADPRGGRGLLRVCDHDLEGELRGLLGRDDDYRSAGKPVCDYDDPQAREALVDALARDARALLAALDGRKLEAAVTQAAAVLAAVAGQDLDEGEDGVFRIARRVAKDRVILTVDSEARHGHKTAARGFDGYKGHVAVDPDSELITATTR
jgi:hypothetical protein